MKTNLVKSLKSKGNIFVLTFLVAVFVFSGCITENLEGPDVEKLNKDASTEFDRIPEEDVGSERAAKVYSKSDVASGFAGRMDRVLVAEDNLFKNIKNYANGSDKTMIATNLPPFVEVNEEMDKFYRDILKDNTFSEDFLNYFENEFDPMRQDFVDKVVTRTKEILENDDPQLATKFLEDMETLKRDYDLVILELLGKMMEFHSGSFVELAY